MTGPAKLVTLFMPVKDRPQYFARVLNYLDRVSSLIHIVVGDGSESATNAQNYKRMSEATNLPLDYYRYDPDELPHDFFRKLNSLIGYVDTEYVYWLPEDDFVLVSTLERAAFELEGSSGSAWMGGVFDFDIAGHRKRVSGPLVVRDSGYECSGRYRVREAVQSQYTEDRLKFATRIFVAEALLRTDALHGAISACVQGKATSPWHLNLLLEYQCLLLGDVLSSQEILLLRQNNPSSSAGKSLLNASSGSVPSLFSPEFRESLERCVQYLTPPNESCAWETQIAWQFADKLGAAATRNRSRRARLRSILLTDRLARALTLGGAVLSYQYRRHRSIQDHADSILRTFGRLGYEIPEDTKTHVVAVVEATAASGQVA